MEVLIISVFILGYVLITLEHTIKLDKLIPALGMMGILWAIIALNHLEVYDINLELLKLNLLTLKKFFYTTLERPLKY